MAKVVIAEKPSVAKNIADAVGANSRQDGYFQGGGFFVTWAFGHLLELYDMRDYDEKYKSWRMENYPFIPDTFTYKIKTVDKQVDKGAEKQIAIIKDLIQREEVSGVISACDYDREGQIIGDIILDYLEVDKPVERLLLNEWTPDEVNKGLQELVSNQEMSPLKDAGISRQWADWMIGINLTSVATLKYQRGSKKVLNIGRVLMPTLKIIYDKDKEIENFEPDTFYRLKVDFETATGAVISTQYNDENGDKFKEKEICQQVKEALKEKEAYVTSKEMELKREYPPVLFNLSGLQGYITSKNKGWTSDKVLKVAQGLYEKKLITYPRTSSLALEESLTAKAEKVLKSVQAGLPYEDEIKFEVTKRVFDNSKVESHSAIMPTYVRPKGLSPDEKIVYKAIRNRFVMQFMPVSEHEDVTVIIKSKHPDIQGFFKAKGKIQKVMGWKKVEAIKTKEVILPPIEEGDSVTVNKIRIETKSTKPPRHHTEKSLLKVMETCGKYLKKKQEENDDDDSDDPDNDNDDSDDQGVMESEEQSEEEISAILTGFSIGTPATRAETISKLKYAGYVETKGKNLMITEVGKRLVECFPVQSLFDLEYTGRLEKKLFEIGKNQYEKQAFLEEMTAFTDWAVKAIKQDDFHQIRESEVVVTDKEILGKCPNCGSPVVEGSKGYGCSNWKSGCQFVVWKDDKYLAALGVKPSAHTVKALLENGSVYGSRFKSKKGNVFAATLYYEKDQETGRFRWRMSF